MNRVTSTVTQGNDAGPFGRDDWRHSKVGWTVQLRYNRRQFTLNFWNGYTGEPWDLTWAAHRKSSDAPSTHDVFECVLSDAACIAHTDGFEDWANDHGYDTDSREAERVYHAIACEYKRVRTLLGDDWNDFLRMDEDELTARCK